jgi:3-deoxy-D-manno-octulosonic-acid transferase
MQKITLIAAQYQEDKNQFIALGANPDQISVIGSLKFDIAISAKLATDIRLLRQQWALNRPVWIAASTHEGEESLLLAAHQKLLIVFPDLLLILVPRHPERFSLVNKLAQQQGFNTVLRSLGQPPRPDHQVLIGDTMGELMLLYGIADLAFIGGSLVNNGGHNPLEAAVHNIPILMGPHTFNFHQISYKLLHAGGLFTVNDKMSVVHAVTALLNDETYRVSFGEQALRVLQQNQGALQKLLERLDPWLSAVTPHKSR